MWFLNSTGSYWNNTASRWKIENYYIRRITGFRKPSPTDGSLTLRLSIKPADFRRRLNIVDAMDTPALSAFIEEEKISGSESINSYLVEKYRRIALPFSTFILMLIPVSLSSRKVQEESALNLGWGLPEFRLHPFSCRWRILSPSVARSRHDRGLDPEHRIRFRRRLPAGVAPLNSS